MELIYKNDLDYKILKLFKGKETIIENVKYKLIDGKLVFDKKINSIEKAIEFEKKFNELLMENTTVEINNAKYTIFNKGNILILLIERIFKDKKIIKKHNLLNGKLLSISTKKNERLHSFNGMPCRVEFRYDKTRRLRILYCTNGMIERYNGPAMQNISLTENFKISNKSEFFYLKNGFIDKRIYKFAKIFLKEKLTVENFYELCENENLNKIRLFNTIECLYEHYKIKNEDFEKLKILISLEG